MRHIHRHQILNPSKLKQKLLLWAQQFEHVLWLDSNNFKLKNSSYDAVLAVDALTAIQTDFENAFEKLKDYQNSTNDWIFGYLAYDLKNDVEALSSNNFDGLNFPELFFFQPKTIFFLKGNVLEVHHLGMVADAIETYLKAIQSTDIKPTIDDYSNDNIDIKSRISKNDYIAKVETLLSHIHRGDIYEANFCQEFYAENLNINPVAKYLSLNAISTPPFASFLKNNVNFALSASPERYLRKEGNTVISQPIKGTSKRSKSLKQDKTLKKNLKNDPKERSENVMIVDLVRNDLAKTAKQGSVKVEELCKVYTFKQVHQMISTITSEVEKCTHPVDILKTTFPMGSMTGAPKISAMTIIEELEETKRGLYSGAIGYFTPNGDFDFNVVIRSILYDLEKKYASISVGGAITAKSNPKKEYEECLVKSKAMLDVLKT